MASKRLLLAEFVVWVVAVGGVVSAGALAVGYLVGGTLVAAKYAVFLVGVALFGVGSLGIQPTPSYKEQKRVTLESDRQTGFEARLQRIPPLRGERIPFDNRVGRNAKVFAASLIVLGVSLVMEFGLGVRP
ncbi:hypothetical protein C475_09779 [Halosimplex carlsbadense 2-9-1]|uniref:Uncharacterized protein n=1 Tax=Halosimplex carlsbadense 2-9-1 TaxID=797114 RepID=M0CV16_9EURY|nr:hypothetical protein [Halosimplex carlsbadense]ELZ25739.1 hypothetical protein C475_09779 [Halosimplex carlsbadense 2-9-1]